MLVGSVIPGNPVRVACDLTAAQIGACAYALNLRRDGRYRLAEMSVDDTLALRALTALVDRFEALTGHGASDTVQLTAAQLVELGDVVREFVVAQSETDAVHPESRAHVPAAASLIDPLSELVAEALKAALEDAPAVDPSRFDA